MKPFREKPSDQNGKSLGDEFSQEKILSVEYDDQHPDIYEPGVYIGIVVKSKPDGSIKVFSKHENGESDIAWLTQIAATSRWRNFSWSTIVEVEEATPAQRKAFLRRTPPDWLRQFLEKERRQ
jgi:hypothetical protein